MLNTKKLIKGTKLTVVWKNKDINDDIDVYDYDPELKVFYYIDEDGNDRVFDWDKMSTVQDVIDINKNDLIINGGTLIQWYGLKFPEPKYSLN